MPGPFCSILSFPFAKALVPGAPNSPSVAFLDTDSGTFKGSYETMQMASFLPSLPVVVIALAHIFRLGNSSLDRTTSVVVIIKRLG